jgi:hypothetical protein
VLTILEPVSEYLRQTPSVNDSLITISSLLLDVQYILVLFTIAYKRNIKYALPFALMYVSRFVIQRLCYLPFPGGSVWRNPGFPTLVVFYDEVGDFYPSGHVAFPVIAHLFHARMRQSAYSKLALY